MKRQFSRRLSPQARKAALLGVAGERVRALLRVSASSDIDALRQHLEQEGTTVGAWMEELRLLSIEVDSARLESIAELPGVVYVEMATTYRD